MDKNSKRNNLQREKIDRNLKHLKSQLPHLDEETLKKIEESTRLENLKQGKIPQSVATLVPCAEDSVFVLDFKYLNESCCRLDYIDNIKTKKLLDIFRTITLITPNQLSQTKLIRDSVWKSPKYESLFSGLTPDVDKIDEIALPDNSRLFCFHASNRFYIISVETKHRNIS